MPHDPISIATLLCAGILGSLVSHRLETRVHAALVRVALRPRR